MHRFLSDERLSAGADVTLSAEESHHLARVVRVGEGEEIVLIDGRGTLARARVTSASPKGCRVRIESIETSVARSLVTVCFGVPKGPALDSIVRRCTEIGTAAFQPLVTRHSLHVKDKDFNAARWQKAVAEVAKQCEELNFPEILPVKSLADWLSSRAPERVLVFCDEAERGAGAAKLTGACDLLVGAEGGWSDEEREQILAAGAIKFGLGRNRLRAETAAAVGLTLVKARLGEI